MSAFHPETLTPKQKEVLIRSAPLADRWGATLAGGTSAALRFGHRQSIDLDWFTPQTVPPTEIVADLKKIGEVQVQQNTEGTFVGVVDGVQYSVFRYKYPMVGATDSYEGSQLVSVPDLAAMKLAAICSRATKKDYVDVHAIMTKARMSIPKMLSAFKQKFSVKDTSTPLRALTYFADAEKAEMPRMLARTSWDDVKRGLQRAAADLDISR